MRSMTQIIVAGKETPMGLALDRTPGLNHTGVEPRTWVSLVNWPRVLALAGNFGAWALIIRFAAHLMSHGH